MASPVTQGQTVLRLSNDEALILYDWLNTFREKRLDHLLDQIFEDQAQQRVLWDVECMLERQIGELYRADFAEL